MVHEYVGPWMIGGQSTAGAATIPCMHRKTNRMLQRAFAPVSDAGDVFSATASSLHDLLTREQLPCRK